MPKGFTRYGHAGVVETAELRESSVGGLYGCDGYDDDDGFVTPRL